MEVLNSVQFQGDPIIPEKGFKVVYFVRHGESTANLRREKDPYDSAFNKEYIDAPITEKGIEQAKKLNRLTSSWNIELLISSPLTRALMTASYAFENTIEKRIPYSCWPCVMEFYDHFMENVGREKEELLKDPGLSSLSRFQGVDLEKLDKNWWRICGDVSRLDHFPTLLGGLKENIIAIVSHSGFVHNLINSWGYGSYSLKNCEWIRTIWKIHDRTLPMHIQPNEDQFRRYSLFLLPAGNHGNNGLLCEILGMFREMLTKEKTLSKSSNLKYGAIFYSQLTDFFPFSRENLDELATSIKNIRDNLMPQFMKENHKRKNKHSPSLAIINSDPEMVISEGVGNIMFESSFLFKLLDKLIGYLTEYRTSNSKQLLTFVQSLAITISKKKFDALLINYTHEDAHSDNLFHYLRNRPILAGGNVLKLSFISDLVVFPPQNSLTPQLLLVIIPSLIGAFSDSPYCGWDFLFQMLTFRLCVVSCIYDGDTCLPWSFKEEYPYSFPLF